MMTNEQIINILQAIESGQKIQHRRIDAVPYWTDSFEAPPRDFVRFEYRVKPEPREFWVNEYMGENGSYPGSLFDSEAEAANIGGLNDRVGVIHVREVL